MLMIDVFCGIVYLFMAQELIFFPSFFHYTVSVCNMLLTPSIL